MLRRCVLSAIASAGSCPITILIADDSVSDVNLETLSGLQTTYPFVRWQRNETNLGIDRNIQNVLAMSEGDYAWLIGEDDVFLPGAVARVFERIQQASAPFVFSNYQYVSEDHQRVLGLALKLESDGEPATARFIEDSLWSIGFIGSCIVRMSDWRRTSAEPYDGSYFTHVGRILDMLSTQATVPTLAAPAIANRAQGDDTFTWKKDSFGVFLGFERMCRVAAERNPALGDAIGRAAVNYRRKFAYFSVKTTFRLRSEGAFDLRQFRVHVARCDIEAWRKAWLLLLALTPRAFLKPLARAYIAHVERRRLGAAGTASR